MEISKIEDANPVFHTKVNFAGKLPGRRCLYFKDQRCIAPRIRFSQCQRCCRINTAFAFINLFKMIKAFAMQLIMPTEIPPSPPPLK